MGPGLRVLFEIPIAESELSSEAAFDPLADQASPEKTSPRA
jgi:hypothetical protein